MEIQLIRDRLVGEMATLPDLQTPAIQSYAVTTAVLVRQVTGALNITDLRLLDAWEPQTHRDLRSILNGLIHYRSFSRAIVKPPLGEPYRYDFVHVTSGRPSSFVINLESYFDLVRRFSDDDRFVARYLLPRVITLLHQVLSEPDKDWSRHLLVDVTDRMYDSLALLGTLIRDGVLVVPEHQEINGYPEVYAGQADRPHSYTIRPGLVAEPVSYGKMLAAYGTTWHWSIGRAEKHNIGGAEVYAAQVLRDRSGSDGSAESVFFRLSDLLEMFKDLQQRVP